MDSTASTRDLQLNGSSSTSYATAIEASFDGFIDASPLLDKLEANRVESENIEKQLRIMIKGQSDEMKKLKAVNSLASKATALVQSHFLSLHRGKCENAFFYLWKFWHDCWYTFSDLTELLEQHDQLGIQSTNDLSIVQTETAQHDLSIVQTEAAQNNLSIVQTESTEQQQTESETAFVADENTDQNVNAESVDGYIPGKYIKAKRKRSPRSSSTPTSATHLILTPLPKRRNVFIDELLSIEKS